MTLRLSPDAIVGYSESPLLRTAQWWERCRLRDVAEVTNGAAFKSAHFNTERDGLPLIRIRDVGQSEASTFYSGDYETRHLVEPGDLLIGMDGDFRIARWNGTQSLLNQRVCRLRVEDPDCYSDKFLEHVVQPYLDEIHKVTSAVTVKHLSSRTVGELPIPLPPRLEQERIVAAIEEHFSRLDAAEAALGAAERKLDATLRSTLQEICRGPWPREQLSDVINSLKNGVFVSRPSKQPPGSPIFRISAVRPLHLRVDDVRYADPIPERGDAYRVQTGDILLTRYSGNPSYVGAAAVVPREGAGILHPDKLIRVVVNRDLVLPEWIAAYLTAGEGRQEIERRLKTTAGQVGISGSQLRTIQIAVPPLSHQQRVIAKISVVQEVQERARRQLDGVATQTQGLRRSILAAGFAGRLVPQDPSDEPASVLLERITASRPASPNRLR